VGLVSCLSLVIQILATGGFFAVSLLVWRELKRDQSSAYNWPQEMQSWHVSWRRRGWLLFASSLMCGISCLLAFLGPTLMRK
jgi:hypothetical protein